ncbi:DUF6701 domain-containing protein [Piscinibacter sp. HJYY11]|uniref:DUF6701 domain-containing protein n=1 Tax=Piscinibacter sp. HJYY11 TaxID=2801333 RepID=UPI00191EB154|nr:DUF6701 domain-containing protein [Piscinibacter sp. HJYY11]MBL0730364.1 hypothetical protein [Piscinibacter sp. HJYY11]
MKRLPRLLVAAALAWLIGMPALSWAQTYTATANATTQALYPWIDISTTGTQVPLADDGVSGDLALGFSFTFGSTTYTTVNITANGMLQFGTATSGGYQNSALPLTGSSGEPNIDAAMLPLWDDLNPDGDGSFIRYRSMGVSPNRVFVVSWLAVPYYCSNSGATCNNGHNQTRTIFATFQVQVHEQGHFVYRYGAVDGSGGTHTSGPTISNPLGATVGYELTNADYAQYSYRSASVPNNTTILWQRPVVATTPGGFNAFDTGTAAGSITGFIRTKVAGTAFDLAVVALNSTRTAVLTTFTGDVRVELLDTSDNSGTLNTTTGCRSTWTSVLSTSTLNFATGDAGRDNISHTQSNSWRDVRLRVSYPATGTATVIGCSTDNFAIRPSSFAAFSVTDTNSSTAGTTRTLANTSLTGGNVHKAGQPFTVRATAVNSSGVTTTSYSGTPAASITHCAAGTACGGTLGTLSYSPTNSSGVLTASNATYSEGGAFNLQLVDTSFAAVDASDGSTPAERYITSATQSVGRFVPDHFDFTVTATPQLRTFGSTCTSRSFTYFGQPFGYATLPRATVTARSAGNALVTNYPSSRLGALQATLTNYTFAPATQTLDLAGTTAATSTYVSSGTADVQATSTGHTLTVRRSTTTPQSVLAEAGYSISVDWVVSDPSETLAGVSGNETISGTQSFSDMAFDTASHEFRYGQLRLGSAYGSDLVALAVPLETQYWNGTSFVPNTADHCTTLATSSVSLANFRGGLAACETAPSATSMSFSSGRAAMRLQAPGSGNAGSVDGTVQLGATITAGAVRCSAIGAATSGAVAANLPWLQSKAPGGTTFDQNPSARFSFGQHKSPLIQLREMY